MMPPLPEALEAAYARDEDDEFVAPTRIGDPRPLPMATPYCL